MGNDNDDLFLGDNDEGIVALDMSAHEFLVKIAQKITQRQDIDGYNLAVEDAYGNTYELVIFMEVRPDTRPKLRVVKNEKLN